MQAFIDWTFPVPVIRIEAILYSFYNTISFLVKIEHLYTSQSLQHPSNKLHHAFFHPHPHWPLCPRSRNPRSRCQAPEVSPSYLAAPICPRKIPYLLTLPSSQPISLLRPLPHLIPLRRTPTTRQHRLRPNRHPCLGNLNPVQPIRRLLTTSRHHRQRPPCMVHLPSSSRTVLRDRPRR